MFQVLSCVWAMWGEPAILLDPVASMDHFRERAKAPAMTALERLKTAEALMLLGAFETAVPLLSGPLGDDLEARKLRLLLDGARAANDRRGAEAHATSLQTHDGWQRHAANTLLALDAEASKRRLSRFGGLLAALAIALVSVMGGRELLRLRRPTVALGAALAVATFLIARNGPHLARIAGLAFFLAWMLVHAARAALLRHPVERRQRMYIAATVVVGVLGIALGVIAPMPISFVLMQLRL